MKIGIIGSGNVGGTLGSRWAQAGHEIVFSSRDPGADKMRQLVEHAGGFARAGTVKDAVADSHVLLLATPWTSTRDAITNAGNLSGKIVIDATNPLLPDLSGLALGTTTSAAESIASWAGGARVVKAFNTIGSPVMADPVINGQKVLLFYCGDDAEAKRTTAQLASELGFDARDAGPLTSARVLEPLALLWISLAFKQGYGHKWGFTTVK